jgi:hypothetical protein
MSIEDFDRNLIHRELPGGLSGNMTNKKEASKV